MIVSTKDKILSLFNSVTPPLPVKMLSTGTGTSGVIDAPVTSDIADMMAKWMTNCPGPFKSDKPCSETICNYRLGPDGGVESCLYMHELRAKVGVYDPNEAVRIVSEWMGQIVPEVRALKKSIVEGANVIQRIFAPLWVKVMLMIWAAATSVQVLSVVAGVLSSL